jgi:hypothetical protein
VIILSNELFILVNHVSHWPRCQHNEKLFLPQALCLLLFLLFKLLLFLQLLFSFLLPSFCLPSSLNSARPCRVSNLLPFNFWLFLRTRWKNELFKLRESFVFQSDYFPSDQTYVLASDQERLSVLDFHYMIEESNEVA